MLCELTLWIRNLSCSLYIVTLWFTSLSLVFRAAIVSLLIAGGAEIGVENQEGETPQMYAEYRNHENVAKLLQEASDQNMGKTDGTYILPSVDLHV